MRCGRTHRDTCPCSGEGRESPVLRTNTHGHWADACYAHLLKLALFLLSGCGYWATIEYGDDFTRIATGFSTTLEGRPSRTHFVHP